MVRVSVCIALSRAFRMHHAEVHRFGRRPVLKPWPYSQEGSETSDVTCTLSHDVVHELLPGTSQTVFRCAVMDKPHQCNAVIVRVCALPAARPWILMSVRQVGPF